MIIKTLLLTLLLLTPFAVKADQPRWRDKFTSANGQYELRWVSGIRGTQKWTLVDKKSAKQLYGLEAEDLGSMTVLVSDDGKMLIAVDDWSRRQASEDLNVLSFYREGKIVKQYTLKQLLGSPDNIQSSVSHFSWFFNSAKDLALTGSRFSLTTFDLTSYTFDIDSGDILKKERDPVLSEGALYVYGKVKEAGDGLYEMQVCHVVEGEIPASGSVTFTVEKAEQSRVWNYVTAIIKDGKLLATKPVAFNGCNYRRKQPPASK